MAKSLRFHPFVASDIRDGRQWYAEVSTELSKSFRELVDAQFDDIEHHPQYFPKAFDDVRFASLKRFPYIILFRELVNEIHVLGVFHGSSDPNKWRRRLIDF